MQTDKFLHFKLLYTDNKENQNLTIYKVIQNGAVAK